MKYNFEIIKNDGQTYVPRISIRNTGLIGLSQGALRRFGLDTGNWHVLLHFDKTAKVIGIQPIKEEQDGSYPLVKKPQKLTGDIVSHIPAKNFLVRCSINYSSGTKIYNGEMDEETGMIVVDLNKEIPKKGRPAKDAF